MNEIVQPLSPLRYVPVGTVFTKQEIGNLSLRELQNRDILDPRFAGFDPHFNWRDYLNLNIMHEHLAAPIEIALDQFSKTERGQHLMRQSLAMQSFRDTGNVPLGDALLAPETQKHRVTIELGKTSEFNRITGTVSIEMVQRNPEEYKTTDGGYANFTYQDILYHELSHAADGLQTNETRKLLAETHEVPYWDVWEATYKKLDMQHLRPDELDAATNAAMQKKSALYEQFLAAAVEHPAIAETNRFIVPHYGAKARALEHSAWRKDEDGGTYFFESIALPLSVTYSPADVVEPPQSIPNKIAKDTKTPDL